jgi:hypothetical protein
VRVLGERREGPGYGNVAVTDDVDFGVTTENYGRLGFGPLPKSRMHNQAYNNWMWMLFAEKAWKPKIALALEIPAHSESPRSNSRSKLREGPPEQGQKQKQRKFASVS